jgi:hypothetical protein
MARERGHAVSAAAISGRALREGFVNLLPLLSARTRSPCPLLPQHDRRVHLATFQRKIDVFGRVSPECGSGTRYGGALAEGPQAVPTRPGRSSPQARLR